jgi:hypothetical protein
MKTHFIVKQCLIAIFFTQLAFCSDNSTAQQLLSPQEIKNELACIKAELNNCSNNLACLEINAQKIQAQRIEIQEIAIKNLPTVQGCLSCLAVIDNKQKLIEEQYKNKIDQQNKCIEIENTIISPIIDIVITKSYAQLRANEIAAIAQKKQEAARVQAQQDQLKKEQKLEQKRLRDVIRVQNEQKFRTEQALKLEQNAMLRNDKESLQWRNDRKIAKELEQNRLRNLADIEKENAQKIVDPKKINHKQTQAVATHQRKKFALHQAQLKAEQNRQAKYKKIEDDRNAIELQKQEAKNQIEQNNKCIIS